MNDEIRVSVASYGPGRNLMMTYVDPITGKKVAKTSGTRDEREAERRAAVWQDELNTGRYQAPSKLTWAEFRRRYEAEKLATLAPGTQVVARGTFDAFERLVGPDKLCKVTAAVLSRFQEKARGEGVKDTTVARHLRHLRAALRWGERLGLLAKAPKVEMPKRAKGQSLMKGRPVTGEEFWRMLRASELKERIKGELKGGELKGTGAYIDEYRWFW